MVIVVTEPAVRALYDHIGRRGPKFPKNSTYELGVIGRCKALYNHNLSYCHKSAKNELSVEAKILPDFHPS